MKRIFTLWTFLLCFVGGVFAGQVTLFEADFTQSPWAGYSWTGYSWSEAGEYNGIYASAECSISSDGVMTYIAGGNMSSSRFCAVRVSGVNKTLKITFTLDNQKSKIRYNVGEDLDITMATAGSKIADLTGTQTVDYTMTGTGTDAVVYFGQGSSSYTSGLMGIKITTSDGTDEPVVVLDMPTFVVDGISYESGATVTGLKTGQPVTINVADGQYIYSNWSGSEGKPKGDYYKNGGVKGQTTYNALTSSGGKRVLYAVAGDTEDASGNSSDLAYLIFTDVTAADPTITVGLSGFEIIPGNTQDKIYYTTDGSDPTSSSTLYSGPFLIKDTGSDVTIKAIAYDKNDANPSGITEMTIHSISELEVPGTVIWSSDEAQTVDWGSGKSVVIPAESFADVKVGDVLNIGVLGAPADAAPDNWTYQVALQEASTWKNIESGEPLKYAGDYVHSFVITGDMLKLLQAYGLGLNGTVYNVKKVAVKSTYSGSEESIWVDDFTISGWNFITIMPEHFANANDFAGVAAGQIIRINGAPTSEANLVLHYQGPETSWAWTDFTDVDVNSCATETGYDIPVTEEMATKLKENRLIIQGDGGVQVTSIELLPAPIIEGPTVVDIKVSPSGDISQAVADEIQAVTDAGNIVGDITIELSKGTSYTISSTISGPGNIIINGNGATIDASGLSDPVITLNGGTTFAPKADGTESDHVLVENVTIKDVTITGQKGALLRDAQKSLVETVTIENSVIEMPAAGKNVLDFNSKGYAGKVIVKNSTIWSAGKNTGFFAQYGSRPKNVNGDLLQEFDFENSTIVNIANGKNFNDLKQNGTAQNVYTIKNNIFSDCGKAGQVVVGFNKGQNSATPVWDVDGNTFLLDGADNSAAEISKAGQKNGEDIVKNCLTGDPEFADAANGDFTVGAATDQAEFKTGDPRWLVPFDGGEADPTALLSEIDEATKLLKYSMNYYDENNDESPNTEGKALVDAIRNAQSLTQSTTPEKVVIWEGEFTAGAWDAAALRFSDTEGKNFPFISDEVYNSLKTLIVDVKDATDGCTARVMNGWWSTVYQDNVSVTPGEWEIEITEDMAADCAKTGKGFDLNLLLINGSATFTSVYYIEGGANQKQMEKALAALQQAEINYANALMEYELLESEEILAGADPADEFAAELLRLYNTQDIVRADYWNQPKNIKNYADELDKAQKAYLRNALNELLPTAEAFADNPDVSMALDTAKKALEGDSSEDLFDALYGLIDALDTATDIRGVEADKTDAPVYNMAGQRVGKNVKGIVIKNGRKIIRR
ncbi:MAG: DUF5123 domain-containing protein [Prevotella sp.]|nr:DUF5123 domain-containing protein [Prevotella sp.]